MEAKAAFDLVMGIHEQCGDKNEWYGCREEAMYASTKYPSFDKWNSDRHGRSDLSDDQNWSFDCMDESFKVFFALIGKL